jgi:hypothetical protein
VGQLAALTVGSCNPEGRAKTRGREKRKLEVRSLVEKCAQNDVEGRNGTNSSKRGMRENESEVVEGEHLNFEGRFDWSLKYPRGRLSTYLSETNVP